MTRSDTGVSLRVFRWGASVADLVVSNEGERYLLALALGRVVYNPAEPFVCHVYTNDYTPNRDVELGDLTEGAWPGYAAQELDASGWTDPQTLDGQAVSWYHPAPVEFTFTSGTATAYGFYVTDYAGTTLLWVQRFDAPLIGNSSVPIPVRPAFGARSQSEPSPP